MKLELSKGESLFLFALGLFLYATSLMVNDELNVDVAWTHDVSYVYYDFPLIGHFQYWPAWEIVFAVNILAVLLMLMGIWKVARTQD